VRGDETKLRALTCIPFRSTLTPIFASSAQSQQQICQQQMRELSKSQAETMTKYSPSPSASTQNGGQKLCQHHRALPLLASIVDIALLDRIGQGGQLEKLR
jgi:hypothetical protein